jgi:hypothetical protein
MLRDGWLADCEKQRIQDYPDRHPLECDCKLEKLGGGVPRVATSCAPPRRSNS